MINTIVPFVDVWITKEMTTEFIPREKIRERPEVHVAGICIKIDVNQINLINKIDNRKIKILIAKRNINRKLYPGLYEGCGGQLAYSEYFTDGVKRHFKLEMNIDVQVLENIHQFYKIDISNQPLIPGIRYICIYKDGSPGSKNHSEINIIGGNDIATRKECLYIENAAGVIKDTKVLEAKSDLLDRLTRMHTRRILSEIPRDVRESYMMDIRDSIQHLRTGIIFFESACDISKLGDRLDQYQSAKDQLEQFRKEPENLRLAIGAGTKIYGAVFSKIGKGLIECRL